MVSLLMADYQLSSSRRQLSCTSLPCQDAPASINCLQWRHSRPRREPASLFETGCVSSGLTRIACKVIVKVDVKRFRDCLRLFV